MKELDFALIGQRLKQVRTDKKLTQEYVANCTEVNVSHISNIETNKVKVSLTLLVAICNALDTTVDYILGNEYDTTPSATEQELLNIVKNLTDSQKEQLLRIAKAL